MVRQDTVFLKGEGNEWHRRNLDKAREPLVLQACLDSKISPTRALEFGCGAGFNIGAVCGHYQCAGHGIDPSMIALHAARQKYPDIKFSPATTLYKFLAREYDLIIYGFCLYVCDPGTLSQVAATGDNALMDGGYLVIQDFDPEYPHKVPYHHVDGLFSYKMDYSKLWLANPAYSLVQKRVYAEGEAVWVLKKNIAAGWPTL